MQLLATVYWWDHNNVEAVVYACYLSLNPVIKMIFHKISGYLVLLIVHVLLNSLNKLGIRYLLFPSCTKTIYLWRHHEAYSPTELIYPRWVSLFSRISIGWLTPPENKHLGGNILFVSPFYYASQCCISKITALNRNLASQLKMAAVTENIY